MITFVDMRGLGSTVDDVSDSWEELVTEVMSFSYVSLVLHYASFCGDERKSNFKNTIKFFPKNHSFYFVRINSCLELFISSVYKVLSSKPRNSVASKFWPKFSSSLISTPLLHRFSICKQANKNNTEKRNKYRFDFITLPDIFQFNVEN